MVKVRIDMDERWCWWPVVKFQPKESTEQLIAQEFADDEEMAESIRRIESPSMEITEELFKQYEDASAAYNEVMGKLEQLYRKQEGYTLHEKPELPPHRMLNENK